MGLYGPNPMPNDPCLFIDDDGKGYLYFHGKGSDYMVAEMADDLLSVKGDLYKMDMGGYEPKMEGPWIFKRDDFYYCPFLDCLSLSYTVSKSTNLNS